MIIVKLSIEREDGTVIVQLTGDAMKRLVWDAAPCGSIVGDTFTLDAFDYLPQIRPLKFGD